MDGMHVMVPEHEYLRLCDMEEELERVKAERDELREKLARALDHAHAISKLADLEGGAS